MMRESGWIRGISTFVAGLFGREAVLFGVEWAGQIFYLNFSESFHSKLELVNFALSRVGHLFWVREFVAGYDF